MSHPDDLTVKRGKAYGQYLVYQHGKLVGEVAHTGTHLDHYPWDWFLVVVRKNFHTTPLAVGITMGSMCGCLV